MLGTLDPLNPWGGLAFASTLLSVAACNFSLLGLLFLVLFLVWAMYCLPALHSQRGLAINRAYWGTVAGLSTIALLVQCGVQLAFIAQTPGIRRPFITQFLRLVGFARINSYAGFVTHFVSILIASITTVYAATKAVRRRENRVSFRGNQNVSETGVDSTAVNTWALTFLAMLGIVFPRPSLVSLPYLMSLLIKASTLEANTGAIRSEMSMHARLQGYAALHLAALYSWQWVPLPSSWHLLGGEYLGLFVLSSPDGKHGWLAIVEGVTVLGWLAVMVIVQGWDLYHFRTLQPLGGLDLVARVLHVDDQEGTLAVDEQSRCSGQEEETEESQLTDPLLEPYPPSSPPFLNPNPDSDLNTGNHQTNISLSMYSCPSLTFLWILNTWRSVCCHTNLVACTVCAISLLRPSVTGFILLLLGIAMSLHWRGAWRVCIARFTAFVVAVWMLTSYIATVWKGTDLEATPTLEAWGVHAFDGGAPLVLMFMTLASLGSYALGALGGSDAFHQSPAQDPPSRYHPAACLGSFRTLSTASLLVTLFFLGTSQYTWIHGIYLASIFLWLAHLTLWSLCPTVNFLLKNSSPFVGNVVFSVFTVLIVICMYFVYVASLDPFNGVFHWMDQFPHVVAALQIAGLWDPKVKDIALALAVLFLSLAGEDIDDRASASAAPVVMGVHTWRPWWLISIARSVYSSGLGTIIGAAVPAYLLLLYDCSVALLGLGYIAIFFLILGSGPLPSAARWTTGWDVEDVQRDDRADRADIERAPSQSSPPQTSSSTAPLLLRNLLAVGMDGEYDSGTRLWLDDMTSNQPWVALHLLCCLATLDFTLQALLPAFASTFQGWSHDLPWAPSKSAVLDFMSRIVGVDPDAYGTDFALRLARPMILLATTALIKYLYAIGVAHDQVRRFNLIDTGQALDGVEQVESEMALNLNLKDNIGLFSGFLPRMGILHSSKLAIVAILVAAMDVPSAMGMAYIVGSTLGTAFLAPPRTRSSAGHRALASFLLFSAATVAALWTCARYAIHMPFLGVTYVEKSDALMAWLHWLGVIDRGEDLDSVSSAGLERSLRPTMAIAASISFKYITLQWLDGLPACIRDDPESLTIALYGSACPSWLGPALTARTSTYSTRWTERVNRHFFKHLLYKIFGFYSNSSVNEVNNEVDNEDAPFLEEAEDKEFVNLWQAAREWMERWFADWGMDIVFLTLLIAAFLSANVYSLLYFFAVVLGMTNHHRLLVGVTVIWTWVILPLIALSLVWMYYVTGVGPPPPLPHWPLSALLPQSLSPDVDTWLGLSGGMNVPALLTISAAYFLAVCHLQSKSYESGIGTPHSGSNGPLTNDQRALWAPLTRDAMPTWRLHDRIRYAMYRRSLEALLIAVVLVCVMENDIIHAGYLAIALFFFRSRLTLRAKRNSAFAILPAYNMAVMAVALAYQAPIPNSSGDELHGSSDCGGNSTWDWGQDCTLGHLLGLYKLTLDCDTDQGTCTPRIFSSYGYRTAAVDLLLWLLIRLQTHVFGSSAFVDAASVVEAQEEEERERRREMERQWMDDQATAALFESKHREARNARILRMKQDGGGWLEVFKAEQGDERNEKHADGTESVVVQPESVPTDLGKDNEIEAEVGSSMVETRDRCDAKIISKSKNKNKRKSEAMLPLTEYERHLAEASTPNLDQVGPSNARGGRAPLARESLPAYVLFVVAYLADLSLFSLLLPLSAFAYSLVSVRPSRMYWHVVLVYCELLIVAGFAFRVPARLGCEWAADPDVVKKAKIWGLHSDAFLSIPLFLVYLVTLHHVQGLAVRHAAGQRLAAAALDGEDGEGSEERSRTTSRHQTVVPWLSRALAAVSEFLMQACTPSERPPSFLLVDVGTPLTAALEAHEVESRLQRILDTSTELKTSIDIHLRSHFPIPEPESVDEGRYIRRYLFQAVVRHAKHRCLNPSATAAEILLSKKAGQEHDESNAVPYKLLRVESHSRGARDYYAATATLDLLALLYVAVFYNRVVSAAGSISEITSQHAVPIGFLLTLMILFGFVVLDRVVYSLGSTAGKFVLHLIEMALLFSYCSFLAWSPRGPSQSWLIAVFLAIKAASFALSALQLRSGYPPPASYVNGMGRHTFVFMRSISVPSSIAFHIFTAIPFLYEMRQLLDWACTPTTLTLYDWLKLEDINVGLYFAAVMKKAKSGRPQGVPQPRYLKFFQGTLLFSALLILIWVPLLVFSTGNPTYQPPAVTTFSVNATLHLNTTGGVIRTPVYTAGDSGTWKLWAGSNGTLPRPLAPDYVVDQVVTLCSRPDADDLWSATPPARKRISGSKLHARHPGAIELGVVVVRDLPPPSDRGSGPVCVGTVVVPLTRGCLVEVAGLIGMDGRNRNRQVPLVRQINDSASTTAMFPAFWLLRGDSCESRPLRAEDLASSDAFLVPGRSSGESAKSEYLNWADRWVACNVSLDKSDNESAPIGTLEWYPQWWRFDCGLVDSTGQQHMEDVDEADGRAVCPRGEAGPSITVVLDRVQGGIIGATLNKYGVLGLYSVFVYGIGRFLRLGITNLRMRIPYEDLPTTRRLVALCQDIYIARAEGLLELEEELYSVLLAVYRLPSVMYSLTKKNV